jgi:hypothetical protein
MVWYLVLKGSLGAEQLSKNNVQRNITLFKYLQPVVALSSIELLNSPIAVRATLAASSEGLNTRNSASADQILKI